MTNEHPLVYQGNQVNLRPVGRDDARVFYDWRKDLDSFGLMSTPAEIATFEQYLPHWEATMGRTITLLAVRPEDGDPAGFVQAYDISPQEGWCFVLSYQTPDARSQRMGLEAATAFWDYLFAQVNMRKIYMDVAEFNLGWLQVFPRTGGSSLKEEGRFRRHVWHDNRYWDTIRFAVYRDVWASRRDFTRVLYGLGGPKVEGTAQGQPPPANKDARPAHATSPRLEILRRYHRTLLEGKFAEVLVLLADDVVFATSVTTPRFGKEAVEGLLRFRHRMRSQAQAAAGAVPAIAWGLPAEHGNVVKIPGAGASGSVEITWTFDVNDKICAFFLEGSQELMAAYVLSSDPVL